MARLESSLVSVDWLAKNLDNKDLIVLNTTIPKVTSNTTDTVDIQIPNARFFDLKSDFSDIDAPFPNTVPSSEQFTRSAQNLGINNSSLIVVYDEHGIYSSARAWWLFKAFGHENIAILDGGLPAWIAVGFETEPKKAYDNLKGNFTSLYNESYFLFFDDILKNQNSNANLIIDARAKERFNGELPEPRKGLSSGHIPNSLNIPYQELLRNGKMKSKEELRNIFKAVNKDDKQLIFSCGSGITACILALGAKLAGYNKLSVYDGSWTEYGTLTNV
jgi:thiosulfate/3-mercaptopyruvate sulfurtransferase